MAAFSCCSLNCPSTFKYVRNLRKHLTLYHLDEAPAPKRTKLMSSDSRQFDFVFKCPLLSCGHIVLESLKDIINHLSEHARQSEEVSCPFKGCTRVYDKRRSLRSHFDRSHEGQSVSMLKQCTDSFQMESNTSLLLPVPASETENSQHETADSTWTDSISLEEPNSSLLYNLGDFYNQLMHSNRVPYSTVDFIIKKNLAVYKQGESSKVERIVSIMKRDGCSDELIQSIVKEVQDKDEFLLAHDTSLDHNLGSQYHRTKFIEECFPFVAPRTCILNPEERLDKQRSFQYMSVLETFKLFHENVGYRRQTNVNQFIPSPDMYQGITDGEFHKTNPFFIDNPDAVPILMYSDAACLINPLNTGKTKTHKMTGFYFTFGNIPFWNRSKCEPLQVAIYILEQDLLKFGYSAVLQPLIDDLQKLEQGVMVEGFNAPIKAGLALWIADNLGAHEFAGLSKSFSSGYICRFCTKMYRELKEGNVQPCKILDPHTYDEALTEGTGMFGVQKPCPLNVLSSFHCAGQCPPCYAHDILEGVASYDLHAYIKILITAKKSFTLDQLNRVQKTFDYTKYNKKDVPPPIVLKNKFKLSMSAGQMRVFLRYVGMFFQLLKCDSSDPVCRQIILLSEIFAYAASPRMHRLEIEDMDYDIHRYLDTAQEILGKEYLRPKHHFLAHYGDHYMHYGPLNNVSSLRYESKHRFAKDTVHKSKNFKNVTKLLAVRHQRLQSHLLHTGLFPTDLAVHGDAIHVNTVLAECDSEDTFNCAVFQLIKQFDNSAAICKSLTFRSTLYEPGLLVVISINRFSDLMTVARILKCFVSQNEPAFIVRKYDAVKTSKGFYKTYSKGSLVGLRYSDLLDYMPLIPISTGNKIMYALHHYITSFT
jgi:hypothetical protein